MGTYSSFHGSKAEGLGWWENLTSNLYLMPRLEQVSCTFTLQYAFAGLFTHYLFLHHHHNHHHHHVHEEFGVFPVP
jgi:hypothetical protein